jgi:transcriptional regulator with XRE-family HTH domain
MSAGQALASSTGTKKTPGRTDIHVGRRVRMQRTILGLSQERFGGALTISMLQVQKHEYGVNRIGASRLFDIACVLHVQIG